jgi:putative oxidoreductase
VQRLFSTFANGWPGKGLLIQRLLVGAALFYHGFSCLTATPICGLAVQQSIGALAGILLIAGLWTPVAGMIVAVDEAWVAVSAPAAAGSPIVLAILGSTLAMIGPGAWSVDAFLYGRKHITFPEP